MCAIVDTNVYHEVFSTGSQSDAGKYFYDWLMKRNGGTFVSGGEHLRELNRIADFKRVFAERLQAGRARRIPDDEVDSETDTLRSQGICSSDDEHVLALARVSGARLLFTNDNALQDDFRDRQIVGGTQGRIYTTQRSGRISRTHRDLLQRRDLCDG